MGASHGNVILWLRGIVLGGNNHNKSRLKFC